MCREGSRSWQRQSVPVVAIGVLVLALATQGQPGKKHPGANARLHVRDDAEPDPEARAAGCHLPWKHPARMKVRATSTTFSGPAPAPLAKVGHARRGKRTVNLRLTAAGKAEVASCEARAIQVRAGKRSATASLTRDSSACSPKPIDLSRASDCDFIGQQQGSLCMLPFPDDYYSVADSSTATGRRIDFHSAGMPKNGASVAVNPTPYNLNDGFSPGVGDGRQGPGPGQPGCAPADERRADQPPRPLLRARSARRRDRRHHRPALADLGGDRLERGQSGEHSTRDPSGGRTSPRATATSSRCAT